MKHIHIVGIGGAGLSALARVMRGRGYTVSGSDPAPGPLREALAAEGITVWTTHAPENIRGADLVVITSAAREDNPEILAAHLQNIPVLKRREFLREVTAGYDTVAIAGSHGKTTTTAMIALALSEAGLDPTVVVGGIVPEWESNARVGASRRFVVEADEYDHAFLGLTPQITVLTNVDYDHPDLFGTREAYQSAFAQFLTQTRIDGVIIVSGDDPTARDLAHAAGRRVVEYGMGAGSEWRAQEPKANERGGTSFAVFRAQAQLGELELQIPGRHAVLNALAALAASAEAGAGFDPARRALERFGGVERRFQARGSFHGAVLIDDYAHHPTEIRATLAAARARYPHARIWAIFQPHTFTRTRALLDEFAEAFDDADRVIITEIYAAREQDVTGLSALEIVKRMRRAHAIFLPSLAQAQEYLETKVQPGDVVLTMGAGNVNQIVFKLADQDRPTERL